jgi:hypothetical protein
MLSVKVGLIGYQEDAKMGAKFGAAFAFGCLASLAAGVAMGDGIQLKITNDGTQDIVVTVYDMNARPSRLVLQNARINGFSSVPISALGDAAGRANLSWTATSVDPAFRKCGHNETLGIGEDSAISVYVDSSCGV